MDCNCFQMLKDQNPCTLMYRNVLSCFCVCVHCCSANVIFVFCIFLYGSSYLLSSWSKFLAIRLHFFIGVSAIHALVRKNKSCAFLFPLSLCIVWLQQNASLPVLQPLDFFFASLHLIDYDVLLYGCFSTTNENEQNSKAERERWCCSGLAKEKTKLSLLPYA